MNLDFAPKDLNDGMNTQFTSEFVFTEMGFSKDFEMSVGVNHGGQEIGPMVPHVGLLFNRGKDKKQSIEFH